MSEGGARQRKRGREEMREREEQRVFQLRVGGKGIVKQKINIAKIKK
jgi:hypothetical protein